MFTVNVEAQQNKFKNRYRPEEPIQTDVKNTSNTSSTSKESSNSSGTKRARRGCSTEEAKDLNDDPESRLRSKRKKNGDKLVNVINEIKYTDKREKAEMVSADMIRLIK